MDTLPAEIILTIGSYIYDIKDRLRLLQVCRRWLELFSNVVYNQVYIEGPQIEPLTKIVLANRQIGAAIRDLSVRSWSGSYEHPRRYRIHDPLPKWAEERDERPLPERADELIKQLSPSRKYRKAWAKDLSAGNKEAWLALLLASVPNLTTFSGQYCENAPRVTRVVSQAARKVKEPPFDARPALQRLKTLNISSEYHGEVYPDWQFLPFFHLPSIRNVNLSAVKETGLYCRPHDRDRPDDPVVCSASGTAPVESLTMEHGCNGRKGMADLITSCANLKHFKYQHEIQMSGLQHIGFQPRRFHRVLLSQKHSLEVLHLSHRGLNGRSKNHPDEDEEYIGPDRWFGSLAEFSQLQELRIRAQNLLNYHDRDKEVSVVLKDNLPPSLRWLHVAECHIRHNQKLLPNLEGVLAHHKEKFPSLEQISVSPAWVGGIIPGIWDKDDYPGQVQIGEGFKRMFVEVAEMCDRAGIKFEFSLDGSYQIYDDGAF
jgi:hypothetical protein